MTAVQLDRVSVVLGNQPVVDDVSFVVPQGQVTGLVGPNGAGKSTLIRCLLGHVKPDRGVAYLFGRPVGDYPTLFGVIGAVADSVGLDPRLTPRRSLSVIARAAGRSLDEVDASLVALGASTYADQVVGELSTGMTRRVALAAALLGTPALLILDEPTNGLDPDAVRWLREYLPYYAALGGTVLLSSHLLGELERCIDHLVVLDRQVLYAGPYASYSEGDLEAQFFALVGQGR